MQLPKTRKEALELGVKRYFTGEPCKNGHVAERLTSTRNCVGCRGGHRRKWIEENPEKKQEQDRRHREKYRDKRSSDLRKWKAANPNKVREQSRKDGAKYRERHPDRMRAKGRAWDKANRDKRNAQRRANRPPYTIRERNWRKANPERSRDLSSRWRLANPERSRTRLRNWCKANPGKVRAYGMARHAAEINAVPAWLTEEQRQQIAYIYEQCSIVQKLTGVKHHVDHIEPLRGKDRSGLHVPWNLQVMTAYDNISKGNRAA